MNSVIPRLAKSIGLWGVLIFFVVLLTLVFSFMGTLICATLAGMMMGAVKVGRRLVVAVSLLLPAIVFVVLHLTKAELQERQIGLVSLLCFGGFWFMYAGAGFLIAAEQRQSLPSSSSAETAAVLPRALRELSLDELNGTWLSHAGPNEGSRVLEIKNGKLVLSVLKSGGELVPIAERGLTK